MEEKLKQELEKLVDVVAGKMTLKQINNEIFYYMLKSPELLVITIERKENQKDMEKNGYHSVIYMTKEDFEKKC